MTSICLTVGAIEVRSQSNSAIDEGKPDCSQTKEERERRMAVAEREGYMIRHIYFLGNFTVRDRDLRGRLNRNCREGDVFRRDLLRKGVKQLAKMKAIFPVTIEDVEVTLDEKGKEINLTIKVKQRANS